MSRRNRKIMSLVAFFAITVHAILFSGLMQVAAGSAVDPFSVICHSGPQTASPDDSTPATPATAPSRACDHCNLCSAAPAASRDLSGVISDYLTPPKLFAVLRPADAAGRDSIDGNPAQAQGPPATT